MNKRSRFIIYYVLIGIGALLIGPSTTYAQDENLPEQAADEEVDQSTGNLGNVFAKTLQNMLKNGSIFVPNGETATPSTPETEDEPEKFKLNFNNAPIDQILKFLSDLKNKVVLKSNEVDGQFTIMNPNEVTASEAMNIIDAAFGLQGVTYIETDQMILVLTVEGAKKRGVAVDVGTGEEKTGSRVTSRVIKLQYASPSQLRSDLSAIMPENANVIADDRTRSMIITDTSSNISRLEKIIRELDQPGYMDEVAVRVFQLRYLNASEMARDLDDILENIVSANISGDDGGRRRGRGNTNVEVMGDRATNSLIISAPREAIDEVAEFIERLDVSSSESMVHETISLKNADASEISQGLNELLRSRTSNNYRPTAFADTRTNSVVISAYKEDVDSIKEILNVLDAKKSYEKTTKVFPLENADAIILSEMLQQLIGDEDSSRNRFYYYRGGQGQDDEQIKIIEDQRLNALIVTAKPSEFDMIEDLIKELDQPLPQSKEEPRVYPIKYARASDISNMVNELFASNQTGGGGFFSAFNQQQNLTGLSGKIKVISDATTNSVIVIAGTPRAFGVVEALIEQLDRKAPEFATTQIFKLNNADAEYLSQQLNELFQDEGGQGGNQGFFWYLNNQSSQREQISNLIGNVRIVPETRTNSLLVTSNAQYFEPIGNLLEELDREISQILIEILIVEVTDIKDNEFGINWPDDISIESGGEFQSPLSEIAPDKALILSQSEFTTVLNLLSKSDKTSVVARPNIFTGDNQRAYVEIVTEVPVLGETTLTNVGTTSEIIFREPGLKLVVNPHINDATTVTIDVDLETGQVDERVSLRVHDTDIPGFSRRKVETKLTIEDEETAVLSGVIDTSYSERENGIPVLMHIPIIGHAFKSTGKFETKTELLTFITPYIVKDAADRLKILKKQSSRIELYEGFQEQMKDIEIKTGTINSNAEELIETDNDLNVQLPQEQSN